jgi:hypothetical protein
MKGMCIIFRFFNQVKLSIKHKQTKYIIPHYGLFSFNFLCLQTKKTIIIDSYDDRRFVCMIILIQIIYTTRK